MLELLRSQCEALNALQQKAEPGTPATLVVGSDRYPAYVVKVSPSGQSVTVCEVDAPAGPGHDFYREQNWQVAPWDVSMLDAPASRLKTFRFSKKLGRFKGLYLGAARKYQDPSF